MSDESFMYSCDDYGPGPNSGGPHDVGPEQGIAERYPEEYAYYISILSRCYNPDDPRYWIFGRRGVKVCDRWRFDENGHSGFYCFMVDDGPIPPDMAGCFVPEVGDPAVASAGSNLGPARAGSELDRLVSNE